MIKRPIALILTFLLMIFCTGCWNNRDLTEYSILTALGIDKKDNDFIEITAQIIKPNAVSSSGAGSNGGGGDKKSFVAVTHVDRTIFAALRGLMNKVNNKIFYSSSQVIVIGEDLARSGICDYIDFVLRDHETQYTNTVVVAKGVTAKEIIEQDFELSKVPGAFIRDTVQNSVFRGFTKKINLLGMARELALEGRELSIGVISKPDQDTISEGLAVFRNDKIVGFMDKYQTRGYAYITNRVKSSVVEMVSKNDPKKVIAIELMRVSSKIKPKLTKDKKVEMNIQIKVSGNIGEQHSVPTQKNTDDFCMCVEKDLEEAIKQDCEKAVLICQKEFKSDIFGFGMHVYDDYPKYWSSVSNKWNEEIFPEIKVNIDVQVKILRTGLISKSIQVK